MALTILYFAWVRERVGRESEQVEPSLDVATLGDLAAWLSARSPAHREAFADIARIRAAIDREFATLDAPIGGAREIAFFPPVTGG